MLVNIIKNQYINFEESRSTSLFQVGLKRIGQICYDAFPRISNCDSSKAGTRHGDKLSTCLIFVDIVIDSSNTQGYLRLYSNDNDANKYLTNFQSLCGGAKAFSLNVELRVGSDHSQITILADGIEMQSYYMNDSSADMKEIEFQSKPFSVPPSFCLNWDEKNCFKGVINIYAEVSPYSVQSSVKVNDDFIDNFRNLRNKPIATDIVIVTSDNYEVHCHKAFLIARSDVFATMFHSDTREKKTLQVNIDEFSSDSINALLDYCYYNGLEKAFTSPSVALDLLKLSDKYNIPCLNTKMINMIVSKDTSWISLKDALGILWFSKKKLQLEPHWGYKVIEAKATEVLKLIPLDEIKIYFETGDSRHPCLKNELKDLVTHFITY